eukprot:3346895-Lingulodinium_polyedra.AAC.1
MQQNIRAEEKAKAQAEAEAHCHSRVAGLREAAMTAVGNAQKAGEVVAAEHAARAAAAEARANSVEEQRQQLEKLEALRVA